VCEWEERARVSRESENASGSEQERDGVEIVYEKGHDGGGWERGFPADGHVGIAFVHERVRWRQ